MANLAPLTINARALIEDGCSLTRNTRRLAEIEIDKEGARPLFIVEGWAARTQLYHDGSRQLINLVLPGDVLFPIDHGSPPVLALTQVRTCFAPKLSEEPELQEALEQSKQLGQTYLIAQIARLGGMNAEERLVDLIAEMYERLMLAGRTKDTRFDMPLTQAILAELLALTPVHTNRMVRNVRGHQGQFEWVDHQITVNPDSEIEARAKCNLAIVSRRSPKLRRI